MLALLLLSGSSGVSGHGSMVWPPIWQDGQDRTLETIFDSKAWSFPAIRDPATGKKIKENRVWLTDQAYLGGHGPAFRGVGEQTNYGEQCGEGWNCSKQKMPWAAPGVAPELGGGCGIHGGNPFGCPAYNDSRPAGSECGQKVDRGAWIGGSRALDITFPEVKTTEWARGSAQPVAFISGGAHGGGYTYRLCRMPAEGKTGLSEECFAQNVLKFADDETFYRNQGKKNIGKWGMAKKTDLSVGTYPEGSAWRFVDPRQKKPKMVRIYKDHVAVPEDLEAGEYVLSWRWDSAHAAQVWVSCSNVRLV